jgi:hypothetical protein
MRPDARCGLPRRCLHILVCCVLSIVGCAGLVTKDFRLYPGLTRPIDQIAVLECVLNTQIDIDDQINVNPESHTWGGRYELLPGTHRVTLRPYASFLGAGYKNLPPLLPEYTMIFDAEAGKQYFISTEQTRVDKTLISATSSTETYIVGTIEIKFRIREKGTHTIVSRRP